MPRVMFGRILVFMWSFGALNWFLFTDRGVLGVQAKGATGL